MLSSHLQWPVTSLNTKTRYFWGIYLNTFARLFIYKLFSNTKLVLLLQIILVRIVFLAGVVFEIYIQFHTMVEDHGGCAFCKLRPRVRALFSTSRVFFLLCLTEQLLREGKDTGLPGIHGGTELPTFLILHSDTTGD